MNRILHKTLTRLRAFHRENAGQVAIITALSLPVLVLGAGGAMDYSRMLAAKSKLQVATDAAILATYKHHSMNPGLSDAALKAYFHNQLQIGLQSEFENKLDIQNVQVALNTPTHMTAQVQALFPTTFIRLAGIPEMTLGAEAEVKASQNYTEVALVLDVTTSMSGTKLRELKKAARDFLEKIHARLPADPEVFKVAIVPFAEYVNVGKHNRNAWWLKDAEDRTYTWKTQDCSRPCLQYVKKPRRVCWNVKIGMKDETPIFERRCRVVTRNICVKYGTRTCTPRIGRRTVPWDGCVGSRDKPFNVLDDSYSSHKVPAVMRFQRNPNRPITHPSAFNWRRLRCPTPLTPLLTLKDNKTRLIRQINALNANGYTYIPIGLMWGWRVLSGHEPFAEGATDRDVQTRNVNKVIILMTDGANTIAPRKDYPREHVRSRDARERADAITREACTNIKQTNPATGRPYADIITVTFDVRDSATKKLMRDCASLGSFDASSGQLAKVFSDIADRLVELHLSK